MLTRLPNWQSALSAYLTSVAAAPFAYGRFDCGLFVAGAVDAMTGVDVVPGVRGAYNDRRSAFARVRSLCGAATMEALADHLTAQYGMTEVAPVMARRGDVVQLRRGRSSSLGIVAMHGTEILTPYHGGLLRLPLAHAARAWHI
jgi:hypothetical protein